MPHNAMAKQQALITTPTGMASIARATRAWILPRAQNTAAFYPLRPPLRWVEVVCSSSSANTNEKRWTQGLW